MIQFQIKTGDPAGKSNRGQIDHVVLNRPAFSGP
jgi:hypothetical protein